MGEIVATDIILITDLTLVINLQTSKALSYLNFMDDSKILRKLPGGSMIKSDKIGNNFLVIRIPSPIFKFDVVQKIYDSLVTHKLDFIAIDELFPEDILGVLQIKKVIMPKWVIGTTFSTKESFITVS